MAMPLSMRARAASRSVTMAVGTPATMRGAGRPARAAAARIFGMMCSSSVFGPVIQVMVPSAWVPASSSIRSPSAATTSGKDADSGTWICPWAP